MKLSEQIEALREPFKAALSDSHPLRLEEDCTPQEAGLRFFNRLLAVAREQEAQEPTLPPLHLEWIPSDIPELTRLVVFRGDGTRCYVAIAYKHDQGTDFFGWTAYDSPEFGIPAQCSGSLTERLPRSMEAAKLAAETWVKEEREKNQ